MWIARCLGREDGAAFEWNVGANVKALLHDTNLFTVQTLIAALLRAIVEEEFLAQERKEKDHKAKEQERHGYSRGAAEAAQNHSDDWNRRNHWNDAVSDAKHDEEPQKFQHTRTCRRQECPARVTLSLEQRNVGVQYLNTHAELCEKDPEDRKKNTNGIEDIRPVRDCLGLEILGDGVVRILLRVFAFCQEKI